MWKVGDGATVLCFSDRHAYTITRIESKRLIHIQRDKAKLLNGINSGEPDALHSEPGGFCGHTSGVQRYEYTRSPGSVIKRATLRKDGKWRLSNDVREIVAGRDEHYDFNF